VREQEYSGGPLGLSGQFRASDKVAADVRRRIEGQPIASEKLRLLTSAATLGWTLSMALRACSNANRVCALEYLPVTWPMTGDF